MAKFKISDKVTVRSDLKICNTYDGVYVTPEMKETFGKKLSIDYIDHYNGRYRIYSEDGGHCWWFNDEMLIAVNENNFPKLENGMIVKLRGYDDLMIVIGNYLHGLEEHNPLEYYDLTTGKAQIYPNCDIVSVYECNTSGALETILNTNKLKLIWKETIKIPMTIAEIEKALGYDVEIVEE